MQTLASSSVSRLSGTVTVPGDKSMSHRAVMFGALASGHTRITGLLEGEDVMSTAAAMRAMGATIMRDDTGMWHVTGVGARGLQAPAHTLDMGNSGTSARLLSGIVAGYDIQVSMTGDASLQKRPMKRVIEPLSQMGARFDAAEGGRMPLVIHGGHLQGIDYDVPVASAQVKSAILLAGLKANGTTRVREPVQSRDHTERMLAAFGGQCTVGADGWMSVQGGQMLTAPADVIAIPGDPSSAAFLIVAALLVPDSHVLIQNVGLNPTRTGLIDTLIEMGGDITFENRRAVGGEDVADVRVKASRLRGVVVPEARVPSMVDEFPILFVAASCADGETYATGLEELRVKESDRLAMMAKFLTLNGVALEEGPSSLRIFGGGTPPKGGALVETHLDHRIAMSFLVLGCVTAAPVTIDDAGAMATSFPDFVGLMRTLGAQFT